MRKCLYYKMVFELNVGSACGFDGFTRCFYPTCWDIVGHYIIQVVHAFFQGVSLPKCITHTNLV